VSDSDERFSDLPELPEGFCYATTEELALEMGSTPEEARAIDTRLKRICGNFPQLVTTGAKQ